MAWVHASQPPLCEHGSVAGKVRVWQRGWAAAGAVQDGACARPGACAHATATALLEVSFITSCVPSPHHPPRLLPQTHVHPHRLACTLVLQVGGELLHALLKSAHVETAAPSQYTQPGLPRASDPPHGSSTSWSQSSEPAWASSPSSPVPFDDPTAHSASPWLQPAFVHDLVPDHGPAGAAGPGASGGSGGAARVVGMFGLSDQALVQLLQGDLVSRGPGVVWGGVWTSGELSGLVGFDF